MIPLALRAEGLIQLSSKWGDHIPHCAKESVPRAYRELVLKQIKTHQFSYKLQLKNVVLFRWLEIGG